MEHGDIVTKDGEWYVVVQITNQGEALILNRSEQTSTTREEDTTYKVESNPYREWPFVVLPHKLHRMGNLLRVSRPIRVDELVTLAPYEDWLLGEPTRNGGALYLSPTLGLRHLDRIVMTYKKGVTSVIVPKEFAPVSQRAAAVRFSRATDNTPKTVYDHLLSQDDDE